MLDGDVAVVLADFIGAPCIMASHTVLQGSDLSDKCNGSIAPRSGAQGPGRGGNGRSSSAIAPDNYKGSLQELCAKLKLKPASFTVKKRLIEQKERGSALAGLAHANLWRISP